MGGIPELLVKLKDAPDFYVEMTWEFTSWVPLVSRQGVTEWIFHDRGFYQNRRSG